MAFQEIFVENFDTLAPEGQFLPIYGVSGVRSTKWDAYRDDYLTTRGKEFKDGSHYGTGNISVISGVAGANGNAMKFRLTFDAQGKAVGAAPEPILPNGSKGQRYGRYEVRFRADTGPNAERWKTAWLLWPMSNIWPRDGEINFPEALLTHEIQAFMHRQEGTSGSDQDAFDSNVTYADWHVAVIEWAPNSVKFILDGSLVGHSTSRIPNTPMRYVMQTEPALSGAGPTQEANVYVDYVKISSYTEGAPVTSTTRRNYAPNPRPGRSLSKFVRYISANASGTNAYPEGDVLRIDHLSPADSGYIAPVSLTAGVWVASIDAETFGAANNAAFVVKRKSDGALLSEAHISSTNQKRRLVGPAFTLAAPTVVEVVMAQGAYTGLSTGSVRFSNLMIEAGSTPGTYFDGATPDTVETDFRWTGTAFDSPSEAAAFTVPGGGQQTSPGTDPALEAMCREVWKGYKWRYLRFDGAVMQREADNKVPSEAPAYALNIAVQLDDRATFELVESFCRNVLERRNWKPGGPDNWRAGSDNDPRVLAPDLMAWDYRPDPYMSNPANTVHDWNFATDADVDRGKALYQAAKKGWGPNNGLDYLNKALEISRQLDKYGHNIGANGLGYQVSDEFQQQGPDAGPSGRAPGHHTFNGGGEFEMNASYIDQVFNHLAKDIGKNPRYSQHIAGGYDVLNKITNNTGGLAPNVGLAPDWHTFNTVDLDGFALTAGSRGWSNTRANFQKYDGFRTWHRLRWAWDAYKDPEALPILKRAAAFYQTEWNSQGKIAAEYELNGTRLSGGYDNTMFTAGAYLTLSADPSDSSKMATANAIYAAELTPADLYATDADGYKYWAGDKNNKGPTQWAYFGDSWMMFFYLRQAGLWNNFGQTTTPAGGVALAAVEAAPTLSDVPPVMSMSLGFVAEETIVGDLDSASLTVAINLWAEEMGAAASDEAVLSVVGLPDTPAPDTPPPVTTLVDRWLWVSKTTGDTLDLTGFVDGLQMIRGASGLIGAPPVRVRREYVPGLPGAVSRQMIHDVKSVEIPLVGLAGGYVEMMTLVRRMILMMDPVTNDGVLRYISKDGRVSELSAQVTGGIEVDSLGEMGPNGQAFRISLEAVDPYWYSSVRSKTFEVESDTPASWFPFPDLVLGASSVIGEVILNVESDVPTWPTWTVVGPGRNLALSNLSLNPPQLLAMDDSAELQAGQVIQIDTRPRGETARTVLGPGATEEARNWFPKLTSRALWPLRPGRNHLNIVLAGAGPESYVSLAYRDARLTP
jgi:hypothetical protein